jgi:hypothetical protein
MACTSRARRSSVFGAVPAVPEPVIGQLLLPQQQAVGLGVCAHAAFPNHRRRVRRDRQVLQEQVQEERQALHGQRRLLRWPGVQPQGQARQARKDGCVSARGLLLCMGARRGGACNAPLLHERQQLRLLPTGGLCAP